MIVLDIEQPLIDAQIPRGFDQPPAGLDFLLEILTLIPQGQKMEGFVDCDSITIGAGIEALPLKSAKVLEGLNHVHEAKLGCHLEKSTLLNLTGIELPADFQEAIRPSAASRDLLWSLP